MSDHWCLDHAPFLENLLAVIAVTRSLGIWVLGSDIPMAQLEQLEAGRKLIPEVVKRHRGKWHPEDLIDPLQGQDTEWREASWEAARRYLAADGIALSRLEPDPSAGKHTEPVKWPPLSFQQLAGDHRGSGCPDLLKFQVAGKVG